jgi:hypothetical protein
MKETNQQVDRNVWLFFLLTFIYSWLLWLPFVLQGFGVVQLSEPVKSLMTPAVALGAFGPLFSAVILIAHKDRWLGLKKFFRDALVFRIKMVYYLLALLVPLLITVAAHYIVNFTNIDTLPDNLFPDNLTVPVIVLIIPYFIFILFAGGGQEEFGWRGYAQEPLQQRFGILKASILIGIVWGVWHLPLWFMPNEGHTYYSFFAFFIFTVSLSVIIGWLYNASGKKVVIPWLLHAMSNVSVPFFPILHLANVPQPGYWVWVGLHVLVAIGLTVWFMRKYPVVNERNN